MFEEPIISFIRREIIEGGHSMSTFFYFRYLNVVISLTRRIGVWTTWSITQTNETVKTHPHVSRFSRRQ